MSIDLDELGLVPLDGAAPPDGMLEAVEEWRATHPRLIKPRPTTSEADAWFANAAEEVKRARGGP